MTAPPRELTRPGRLGELAKTPGGRLHWLIFAAICDPASITRAIHQVRVVVERESGPLRATFVQHTATAPADIPSRVLALRDGVTAGRIVGITVEGLDGLLEHIKTHPADWLVDAGTKTITTQRDGLAQWS